MTVGRKRARQVTGLHIVGKKKHGLTRWYVYAWRGGPQIHIQDDTRPTITMELVAKAQKAKDQARGIDPDTLEALITEYRASPDFTALADSTQRDYRLWLDRISEKFGAVPLDAFDDPRMRGDILAWRDGWAKQPRTADKASVMMATLLGFGVERGRLTVNRAAGIKHLHNVNKADQIWEDRHWQAMAGAPAHLMDALKLASMTGLRLGDLVALDWEHVGEKAIILITEKRKGRAVIPIVPELRAHLDAREHRTGKVLRNSRGQGWTESGLGSVFQKAKPDGFDRTIHDLRGTYATWLAVKGLTDEQIARIIGWTAKRIAEIRARYVDEARVVVSLIDRLTA